MSIPSLRGVGRSDGGELPRHVASAYLSTRLPRRSSVNGYDGDTIDVQFENGAQATVRLIGIDTPETVDPRRPVGCFGTEATARTREMLDGRRVWLERDASQTDRFGRVLRYVWLDEQALVNDWLVWDGYAQVSTFPPDVRYAEQFGLSQRAARDEGRGLWSACVGENAPTVVQASATANGDADFSCEWEESMRPLIRSRRTEFAQVALYAWLCHAYTFGPDADRHGIAFTAFGHPITVTEPLVVVGGGGGGCGSRGGPGYRLASGRCASWEDASRGRR